MVEITPEMLKAGTSVVWGEYCGQFDASEHDVESLVIQIYGAMEQVRRKPEVAIIRKALAEVVALREDIKNRRRPITLVANSGVPKHWMKP